jgi:hypothetical protein
MYDSTQCLGGAGQWVCWPQEGTKGENLKKKEVIKAKVELLADMTHEDHVKLCMTETPTSHSPSQKNNKNPVASATHKSRSPSVQVTQLCPSSFKLYKTPLWLRIAGFVSLQALHRYWQPPWTHLRPHQVMN